MTSYTDIPELPAIPEGYAFKKFTVERTQYQTRSHRAEVDCKKKDLKKVECIVESFVLECCVVFALCENQEGEELNAIWRVGSSEWGPWLVRI